MVNDAAPDFFHALVTEELNSTEVPDQWVNVTCIPLYKTNKQGDVYQCSSYRSVVLQDSLAKFVNSAWKHLTRAKIEKEGGINHAYRTNSGVFTALADIDTKMKQMAADINMTRPKIIAVPLNPGTDPPEPNQVDPDAIPPEL